MVGLRLDDFDGGFIIAPWDRFKELIEWYSTHLDLKVTYEEDYPVEKMATLTFPALGCIHIKSVEHGHPHFAVDWDKTEMFASASPQRILKLHKPIFANRIFK